MALTKVDPHDVSALLFQKKTDPPLNIEPYVGPVEISSNPSQVSHGRGLVASRTIAAGELLFALPPTVQAAVPDVYQKWLDQRGTCQDERCLEATAESVLLDAMELACQNQPTVAASFASLVGSPDNDLEKPLSMDVLLGQDTMAGNDKLPEMARTDLLNIVRANAFGPDGVHSYENVEERWIHTLHHTTTSHDTILQQTPRLLGIYPLADMVNHSCLANAVRVYARNIMVVHALTEILQGTEIVYAYVPPSQPNRRTALAQQHGFVCQCMRCRAEDSVQATWTVHATPLLDSLQTWNHPRLAQFPSYPQLHKVIRALEDDLLPCSESNEIRRYLRISYLHVYIHYFNLALAHVQTESDALVANIWRADLLALATQLHFSFCACHHASTEHLSVLHLCYDLVARLHQDEPCQPKLRFWTDQLKKAHMVRYGNLGQNIDAVRRVMQHSRAVLRQVEGWEAVEYSFL